MSNFISPQQYGFVGRRPTITNLAAFSQYVSEKLDTQLPVDTVFTDFGKTFDQMDYGMILPQFESFGFISQLLNFFKCYFTDGQQYVFYNDFASFFYNTNSGVLQGFVSGFLIFLVFINDLSLGMNCKILLFADYGKIFHTFTNTKDVMDATIITVNGT